MSSTPEQPAVGGSAIQSAAAAGQPPVSAHLPEPPPPRPSADSVYRPLSVLALAAFVLSLIFTAVMAAVAAVALFNRSPLLLGAVWYIIPLTVLSLSWVARLRIRSSEGTLSGESLASWGLTLTLLVTLLYAAYYAATFFAVRQQAVATADAWLETIKKGNIERAYWLALPPERRPPEKDAAGMREDLESLFNSESNAGATLGNFRARELVSLISQLGEKARFHLERVSKWDFERGVYEVDLRYRLDTPEASGDLQLMVFGYEPSTAGRGARQWFVRSEKFNLASKSVHLTPLGEEHKPLGEAARSLLDAWLVRVGDATSDDGYILTLPPHERKTPPNAGLFAFPALAGTVVLGAADDATRHYATGRLLYQAGSLIQVDPNKFWATKRRREDILRSLRYVFIPGPNHRACRFFATTNLMPVYVDAKDGRDRVCFDAQIVLFSRSGPEYSVDGRVVLESHPTGPKGDRGWRVVALEPYSGYTAPSTGDPRQRPQKAG